MALLEGYVVTPALYQSETGPEAAVGDQVKLFLNVDANPGYPEYIYATIQHPIEPVNCGSATSYIFEYDPADLLVPNSLLLIGDIIGDVYVVSQADLISEALAAETAARIAADNALRNIPNYADDAAADLALDSGDLYTTTGGGRAVFRKP